MKIKEKHILIIIAVLFLLVSTFVIVREQQSIFFALEEDSEVTVLRAVLNPIPNDINEDCQTKLFYYSGSEEYAMTSVTIQFYELANQNYDYVVTFSILEPFTHAKQLPEETFIHGSSNNIYKQDYGTVKSFGLIWTFNIKVTGGPSSFGIDHTFSIIYLESGELPSPEDCPQYIPEETTEVTETETTETTGTETLEEAKSDSAPYYLSLLPIIIVILKRKKKMRNEKCLK